MRNFICLLSICIATLSGATAIAADFKWTRSPDGRDGNGVITVRGTIEPGDHQKLIAALGDNEPAAALPIYVDLGVRVGTSRKRLGSCALWKRRG